MHAHRLSLERFATLFLCALLQWGCVSGDNASHASGDEPAAPVEAPSPVTGVIAPSAPIPPGETLEENMSEDSSELEEDATDSSEEDVPAEHPADEPAPEPARKRNPGHYIALNDWDGDAQFIQAVRPGVTGIHKRYPWADLEPQFGVYDFSRVEADLALAAHYGMRLVIMIEDKSFSMDVKRTPSYLHDGYTLPYTHGGWVAKRWDPWVMERLGLLTRELGQRFDAHPWLEGVAFQETAMGFTPQIQAAHGYSPEKYRDALIQVLITTRSHFPRSQVFWYMNYLEGRQAYLGDVAEAVTDHDIAMGGPDILPDSWPLNFHTYPLYERFKGRMTLFNSVQYDSYKHVHLDPEAASTYWTPEELFIFARDQLHVDYIFWTRKPQRDPPGSFNWLDALPVIAANPAIR
jgi:hypothetical protein